MKFTGMWGRVVIGSLALLLAMSLSVAPSLGQSTTTTVTTSTQSTMLQPITITEYQYPATVTSIGPDTVILDVNGNPVNLPLQFARFSLSGRPINANELATGQKVMVMYPSVTGTVSSLQGNVLVVQTADGTSVLLPATHLTPVLSTSLVFVRLRNGNYVQVPLSTAIRLQNREGATILSTLPPGATLSIYATGDDVMSPRNRGINWSEGVRIQKDPSKLIQDQSIDGDSNF